MCLHACYCPWWMAASQSPFGREIQWNSYASGASARIDQWFCVPGSTDWWFGTFFIFLCIGNNHPNWLSYFQRGWNHQPVKSYVLPCSSGWSSNHVHRDVYTPIVRNPMMGGDMQQSRVLTLAPNWLVAWNIIFLTFDSVGNAIIPADFHFFRSVEVTNQIIYIYMYVSYINYIP